jgi:hypothetical protein
MPFLWIDLSFPITSNDMGAYIIGHHLVAHFTYWMWLLLHLGQYQVSFFMCDSKLCIFPLFYSTIVLIEGKAATTSVKMEDHRVRN